jgi:hypothetical protein
LRGFWGTRIGWERWRRSHGRRRGISYDEENNCGRVFLPFGWDGIVGRDGVNCVDFRSREHTGFSRRNKLCWGLMDLAPGNLLAGKVVLETWLEC